LLQRRGALFEALISNLRQQGVAVAGADRLTLQDNIAVQDVLALMQFCLLPEDDLSLACVLKSPLMDPPLHDDDLIALAPNRKASLWQALQENPGYAAACKTLAEDLAAARSEGPHGFILRVLNRARPFMARRLGDEAVDATNMLVDAALDFERDSGPSLAAFLHAFQARSEDVKRELSQSDGQLRVMTVHGAKGLEADIVILPDAADLPRASGGNSIFAVTGKGNLPLSLPFFDSPTDIKPGALKQWKDEGKTASLHERKRLLYVAMTRARDALYVGGVEGRNQVSEHSWYSLIEAAFKLEAGQGKLRTIAGVHPEGDIRRYGDDPVPWLQAEKPNVKTETPLPLWASAPVLPDTIERHRAASHLAARRGTVIDAVAARRGLAIHRFLEKARSGDADGNERLARRLQLPQQVTEKLLGLMAEPAHAAWFGPEALIEAAIAGNIAGLPPIQGRVDRLSLGDALITVLDFKSGRRTPETLAEYHGQMAGYVELLRLAYPGRRVRAALLWTQDGWLEPLDDAILADAITQMRLAYVAGVT
jgi:ATP-dependent helicase/nuclease subunit A